MVDQRGKGAGRVVGDGARTLPATSTDSQAVGMDEVEALKARSAAHGRSAEAEHREILRTSLLGPTAGKSLWDWLASMPDDGHEEDFERIRDLPREVEL